MNGHWDRQVSMRGEESTEHGMWPPEKEVLSGMFSQGGQLRVGWVRNNVLEKDKSTDKQQTNLVLGVLSCLVLFSVLPESFDYRISVLSMKESL